MRKSTLILLILFSFVFSLFAIEYDVNDSNVLNLRGFKVGEEDYLTIAITAVDDRELVDSSGPSVESPDFINISNDINDLLGTVASNTSFDRDKIVFSYRVAGNTTGNYSISLVFTSLTNDNDVTKVIETVYNLGNLSYSFPDAASSTSSGYTIAQSAGNTNTLISLPGDSGLISYWSVTPQSSVATPMWIHRGSVAMTISSSTYSDSSTPVGSYRANVEVRLVVNN